MHRGTQRAPPPQCAPAALSPSLSLSLLALSSVSFFLRLYPHCCFCLFLSHRPTICALAPPAEDALPCINLARIRLDGIPAQDERTGSYHSEELLAPILTQLQFRAFDRSARVRFRSRRSFLLLFLCRGEIICGPLRSSTFGSAM